MIAVVNIFVFPLKLSNFQMQKETPENQAIVCWEDGINYVIEVRYIILNYVYTIRVCTPGTNF